MPLRNMLNVSLAYNQQKNDIKEQHKRKKDLKSGAEYLSGISKSDRLHPILCTNLYHGEQPWDGPESLYDMLEFPEGLEDMKAFCPDFKMNLIHAWNVDPKNFQTALRKVFELLPYAASKKELKQYIEANADRFSHLTEEECDALEAFIGMDNLSEATRKEYKTAKGDYDMCTALREMVADGRAEGRIAGLAEGRIAGRTEGRTEGIRALIESCREFGKTHEQTSQKVASKFGLEQDEVQKNMNLFWV